MFILQGDWKQILIFWLLYIPIFQSTSSLVTSIVFASVVAVTESLTGRSCCLATDSYLSLGMEAPAKFSTVGKISMLLVGSSMTFPAGKTPGQRSIPGIRIPPSQLVDLPAARETAERDKGCENGKIAVAVHFIFKTEKNVEIRCFVGKLALRAILRTNP